MQIDIEPWGGIAVMFCDRRLVVLVDRLDAWAAWDGRLMWRVTVGQA